MIAELRASVREQTGGRYEVLGELADAGDGSVICLARETRERSLVALALGRTGTRPDGSAEYSVEVLPELDESLITVGTTCPGCGTAATGTGASCASCGADLGSVDPAPPAGLSRTEMLRAVREAAGGVFEVLGEMPRAGGRRSIYFAREIASGRIVALSLRREVDESGEEYFSLGVTQVLRRPDTAEGRDAGGAGEANAPPVAEEPPSPAAAKTGDVAAADQRVCPTCGNTFPPDTRFCPTDGASLLTTSPERGLVGRTIADRYHILAEIGEGGFGKVYLAEHARMGRRCAVKIINPAMRNDADAVGRFSREAANASRINHPNIATVYDFGESAEGLVYLVMEYVDGETLADLLERERPLAPDRAAEIARQIGDALTAAHALGIVHRDLKPQNILLTRTHDGTELVKVVDFGIAKAVQGEKQNITRAGFVIGTLEYMSPEQLMGTSVDGRSDIFSLGCVLFEMLTGERAFAGPDGPISIGRRMSEDPPRVRDRNPSVPQALDEIVAMAVARDAAARFQSAEGLRDALAGVIRTSTAERLGLVRRSTGETPNAFAAPRTSAPGGPATGPGGAAATGESGPGGTGAAAATTDLESDSPGRPRSRAAVLGIAGGAIAAVIAAIFVIAPGDDADTGAAGTADGSSRPLSAAGGSQLLPSTGAGAAGDPDSTAAGPVTEPATLYVGDAVPAGARVTIDGRTYTERSIVLDPGTHQVSVAADGFAAADTTLVVEAGQVVAWSPELRPVTTAAVSVAPAAPVAPPPTPPAPAPAPLGQPAAAADADDVADPVTDLASGADVPGPAADPPPADPPPPPAPATSSPAAIAAGVNDGLDRFARALESRRIEAVEEAYPGMTGSERETWAAFLGGVRTLDVSISAVEIPSAGGESLQVPFTMTFVFTDQRGTQETIQRYLATFLRSGDAWRLAAIRPE